MHLFHDTPDYYNTATLSRFVNTAHADAIVDANDGYGGGGAWSASSADGYIIRYHDQVGQAAFAVGMRFKCTSLPGADKVLLAVVDAAAAIQCCVVLKTTGKLAIYRGNISAQLGSDSADAITTSTQLDLGFKGVVGSVGGAAEIWIGTAGDGDTWGRVVTASGENTAGGTGETWRGVQVGLTTAIFASHLYARDGQGAQSILVPGYRVTCKFPSAAGIYTGYTANTGTLPAALDDTAPDDDTTYAACTATDASYTVGVSDVASTIKSILAVETVANVKDTADGATLTYTPRCVITASTDPLLVDGGWIAANDSNWRVARQRLAFHPITGEAWTYTDVNAAEWGGYALP